MEQGASRRTSVVLIASRRFLTTANWQSRRRSPLHRATSAAHLLRPFAESACSASDCSRSLRKMPGCTLSLLRLRDASPIAIQNLLRTLAKSSKIILASIPQFHVVKSTLIDAAWLNEPFHLLVLLEGVDGLPESISKHIASEYRVTCGVLCLVIYVGSL